MADDDDKRPPKLKLLEGGKKAGPDKKPAAASGPPLYEIVARTILKAAVEDGTPYMRAEDDTGEDRLHQYRDGLWREILSLNGPIGLVCRELGIPHAIRIRNEAREFIKSDPDITRRDVKFDAHGLIPLANGLLDPVEGDLIGYTPEAYATRRGDVRYEPAAECPKFISWLYGALLMIEDDDREKVVLFLQEWMGCALIVSRLPRSLRKALIIHGASRTGKTVLATILRALVGGNDAPQPSVSELDGTFGLQGLYRAPAWIRDDAINEGDRINPERFKTIVTGEAIQVQIKRQAPVLHRFHIPILLTCNSLFNAKETTDAVANRAVILPFNRVYTEAEEAEERRRLGMPLGVEHGVFLFERESAGILNWALAGLRRALERGTFDLPETAKAENQRFKDDNNPIGEWMRDCLTHEDVYKVNRADLMCSYHGWQKEMFGGDAKPIGGRTFYKILRALLPSSKEVILHGVYGYFTGVRLKDRGLKLWETHKEDPLRGGSKGQALSTSGVNVRSSSTSEQDPDEVVFS